ncbi:MAG TPA: hypothetical protein VFZ33_01075 [Chitinophagaceae bacterium]
MSTEERIKEDFAQWVEAIPKPNEYNRMYGHHLTSFKAGALSERNKVIEEVKEVINKNRAFGLIDANGIIETLESLKV